MNIVKIIRPDGHTSKQNFDRFGVLDCGQGYFYIYKLYPQFSSYPDPYTTGLDVDFVYCLLKMVEDGVYKIVAKRPVDCPILENYITWLGYYTGTEWLLIEMLRNNALPVVKRENFSNINKNVALFLEDERTGKYMMVEPVEIKKI